MEASEGLYTSGNAASFFVCGRRWSFGERHGPSRRNHADRSCFSLGIYCLPAGSDGAVLGVSRPLVGLNYTNIIKYETLHAVRKPANHALVNDT